MHIDSNKARVVLETFQGYNQRKKRDWLDRQTDTKDRPVQFKV